MKMSCFDFLSVDGGVPATAALVAVPAFVVIAVVIDVAVIATPLPAAVRNGTH